MRACGDTSFAPRARRLSGKNNCLESQSLTNVTPRHWSQPGHVRGGQLMQRTYGCTQRARGRSRREWTANNVEWGTDDMFSAIVTHGRRGGLVVLAVAAAMGLTACGGPSSSGSADVSSGSNAVSTTTTSGPTVGSKSTGAAGLSEKLKFAKCMRSHGVANYPDPSADGRQLQNVLKAGLNPQSSTYQGALQACKKYTSAGQLSPAEGAADNAKGLKFSQCMRVHGVPNFPDPSTGPNGQQVINLGPAHLDPNSPIVQAAGRVCQKAVPGSK